MLAHAEYKDERGPIRLPRVPEKEEKSNSAVAANDEKRAGGRSPKLMGESKKKKTTTDFCRAPMGATAR